MSSTVLRKAFADELFLLGLLLAACGGAFSVHLAARPSPAAPASPAPAPQAADQIPYIPPKYTLPPGFQKEPGQ